MRLTFLGTASNGGWPQQDCKCLNCARARLDVRNKRFRSSILVENENTKLILDCGPDFREQLIKAKLLFTDINAIVLTHLHFDHSSGLLETSVGNQHKVRILAPKVIQEKLKATESSTFLLKQGFIKFGHRLVNKKLKINFFPVQHDLNFATFGIRITEGDKSLAYVPDIAKINKKVLKVLKDCSWVIFDGTFLSESKHHHLAIQESAPILAKNAKNVIFTHINQSENPKKVETFLKQFKFKLAFDGMEIKL